MTDQNGLIAEGVQERRQRRGTWPWFAVNVLLFPAPSHFTLLRIKDFSFGKSLQHVGLTFFLVFVLLAAAFLQLLVPTGGRLWMLLPLLSGVAVLYAHRSLKKEFKAFDPARIFSKRIGFLLGMVVLFAIVSTLPVLDFIELNQRAAAMYHSWIKALPLWQDTLILIAGLGLLMGGYLINCDGAVSINRAFILYACFVVFINQTLLTLLLAFGWLKVQGGFGTRFIAVMLAAILALDYWDAQTFGQYVRRFFFLTCTKGLAFIFLWVCFLGLPQKAASTVAAHYFDKSRPGIAHIAERFLIFTHQDRFVSGHTAARRLRALYTRAFIDAGRTQAVSMEGIGRADEETTAFPKDADVIRLAELVEGRKRLSTTMPFAKIPLFRPVHRDWDVMLTALMFQGTIAKSDLERFIAGFKASLPKITEGQLPRIDNPHKARYVAMATGTQVEFVPPRFDYLEALRAHNFCPVLYLRLAGKDYWATLLHIDREAGMAWFRIEMQADMQRSIQLLFDSDESGVLRSEILVRSMIPLTLDYLQAALAQYTCPLVVFSKDGLAAALPDLFNQQDLATLARGVIMAASPEAAPATLPAPDGDRAFARYAAYLRTTAAVKALLGSAPYVRDPFVRPVSVAVEPPTAARFDQIEDWLQRVGPLRDCDRADIAYLLVKHGRVYQAADLFVRLTTGKPLASDLVDCRDAFEIGRHLYLLGRHEAAAGFLALAFARHPFNSEYEMWHHIVRAKLDQPPMQFYSPPTHQPDLQRYYLTVADVRKGNKARAQKRLEKMLARDSLDSLANHLLNKYFSRPLDERYFFPAPEGL